LFELQTGHQTTIITGQDEFTSSSVTRSLNCGNNLNRQFIPFVILGKDPEFLRSLKTASAAASSMSNILLLGESGTGKDILAQAMQNAGPRKNNPYLAINCAALSRELIASELFGYEEGAFTGARKGRNVGNFELAD
jgi:transcriptional regulator with PAS, ATPase and Fis domain